MTTKDNSKVFIHTDVVELPSPIQPERYSMEKAVDNTLAPIPLSRGQFWLVLGIMAMSLSSCGIDLNVLGDAAIVIAGHFDSFDRIIWMSASTVMVAAASMLTWGLLYNNFETKFLLIAALLCMATSELLAGLASTFNIFIAGRILAGFALSNILVGSMSVTGYITNGVQRPLFVSLITGCFGLMIKIGPFISGGLLKRSTSLWRWCFLLQLPLIGILLLVTVFFFPRFSKVANRPGSEIIDDSALDRPKMQLKDLMRTVLSAGCHAGAIICLIFPLMAGSSDSIYTWTSPSLIVCYVLCLPLGAAFFFLEMITPENHRFLPLQAIRQDRTIICIGIITFCSCLIIFPSVFYLPLVFQVVFGSSPIRAAVQMMPNVLLGTIACVIVGKVAEITGYFTPTCIALSLMDILASGLMWTLSSTDPSWKVYLYTCLLGISAGGLSALGTPITIERVKLSRFGSASAFINLCVICGGAFGLAGSGVIYNAKIVALLEKIIEKNPGLAESLPSYGETSSVWSDLAYIASGAISLEIRAEFRAGFMKAYDEAQLLYLAFGVVSLLASIICPHRVMLSHAKSARHRVST